MRHTLPPIKVMLIEGGISINSRRVGIWQQVKSIEFAFVLSILGVSLWVVLSGVFGVQ